MQRITHKRESEFPGCCYWFTCRCCWPLRFTIMVKRRELMPIFYCADCAHHVHHDGHLMRPAEYHARDAIAHQPEVSQITMGSWIPKPVIRGIGI